MSFIACGKKDAGGGSVLQDWELGGTEMRESSLSAIGKGTSDWPEVMDGLPSVMLTTLPEINQFHNIADRRNGKVT